MARFNTKVSYYNRYEERDKWVKLIFLKKKEKLKSIQIWDQLREDWVMSDPTDQPALEQNYKHFHLQPPASPL